MAGAVLCLQYIAPHAAAGATWHVQQGVDFQETLSRAQPGDEIVLQAGARFVGVFWLPSKAPGPAITIRSGASLPERRLTPADAHLLPTIASGNADAALNATGASNWKLDGIRFESTTTGEGEIIVLQDATNITLDRLLIVAGDNGQKRAIRGNGRHIVLNRSHIANIWRVGQDSQTFCAWDGAGPYTVTDNYLEAASENVMFGGADSASPARVPADILVAGNHLAKRPEWRGMNKGVKNLLELKQAKRAVIRNNLMEGVWPEAQTGYAILVTVRNDDGTSPWAVVEDVLFEANIVRDAYAGVNVLGYDIGSPSGQTTRVTFRDNAFILSGPFLLIGGEVGVLTFDHNTVRQGGSFLNLYTGDVWPAGSAGPRPAQVAAQSLTITNTIGIHNEYGVYGDGVGNGARALSALTGSSQWTHNVLAGEAGWSYVYPQVTWQPSMAEYASQVNADLTLSPTSIYRNAGTDGLDLGVRNLPPPPVEEQHNTAPIVTLTSPSAGAAYAAPASITLSADAADPDGQIARLEFFAGSDLVATARVAPYTLNWSGVQAGTYALTAVAYDNAGASTSSASATVTVSGSDVSGHDGNATLPQNVDIGEPAIRGYATSLDGAFTIVAAGTDIWDTGDQFHFVYQAVTGDADIIARVVSLANSNPWAKAGVMVRESLTGESRHALLALTSGAGYAFQRRLAPGDYSHHLSGGDGWAPGWIRLVRRGDRFEAFRSSDGGSWTSIGADTIAMGATVYVGLAVTSHDPGQVTTAVIDQVVVNGSSAPEEGNRSPIVTLTSPGAGAAYPAPATITLSADAVDPDGEIARVEFFAGSNLVATVRVAPYTLDWSGVQAGTYALKAVAYDNAGASTSSASATVTVSASDPSDDGGTATLPHNTDIGRPAIPGYATSLAGAFTIVAAGTDIWDTGDQFHFVYQAVTGDVDIIARVVSLANSNPWAKAGVMVRESLTGESRHALLALTPGAGYAFQRRLAPGDYSHHLSGGDGWAPGWIRLVRRGDRFEAFRSSDGGSWTSIGADTIAMGATVYVGLAVTSHDPGQVTTAVIDQVVVNGSSAPEEGNRSPIVTLTSPGAGAAYPAPATITLSADAVDPDGEIARVEFFAGGDLVATARVAPYTLNWSGVQAGTYALTAVAYDNAGASTSSAPVAVTVSASDVPAPRAVAFTVSADHASVSSYVLKIFVADGTGTPVATSDLGKPAPDDNNDVMVNRSAFFDSLARGNYIATVTAISAGGETPSAAVTFAR